MDATKIFRHHDYELHCGARPVDGGRFVPTLIVSKQVWPTRPREIAIRRGDYPTPEEAIDAAYAQGIGWIADFG